MDVNDLLSRLSRVKQTGRDRWIACCPAHEDRTPSMTIRLLDDGRLLVHDFGGCSAADIVDSLGLTLADLFEKPLYHRAKPVSHPFTSTDALRALRREASIVAIAAADLAEGKAIDTDRVLVAAGRIADAAEYVDAIR